MRSCWVLITPVRWPDLVRPLSRAGLLGVLLAVLDGGWAASSVEQMARGYREKPQAATRSVLAGLGAKDPVAVLALAAADLELNRPADALAGFQSARTALPALADFADFGAAKALVALGRKHDAVPLLERVVRFENPVSPMRPWALVMAAGLLNERKQGPAALPLLDRYAGDLPQPAGGLAYGTALSQARRWDQAARELQRVFFEYPRSEEARKAEPLLDEVRSSMGSAYPDVSPERYLERARKLMEGGDPQTALAELTALKPKLTGAARDLADVRIGAARLFAREYAPALAYLRGLTVSSTEADAERHHWMVTCARRLDRWGDVLELLDEFGRRHPSSNWRLESILASVSRPLIANSPGEFEPLYRACYTDFAAAPQAPECSWRYAWSRHIRRKPDAAPLMREHLRKFPASEGAAGALYFLGRRAEQEGRPDEARAYFEAIDRHFPNFYYAVLVREKLAEPAMARVRASTSLGAELAALSLPAPGAGANFQSDAVTSVRIRRARLLASAALYDWAELELKFGVTRGARPMPVGVELGEIATRKGSPQQALRHVKNYVKGYLHWNFEHAPPAFWRLAFPLPYRGPLRQYSAEYGLDPYLMAGLIRQESEFDARVVSRATAVGLTQIMPATGRELSRRLGIRGFTTAMLKIPEINLRMGAYYLRSTLDSLQGSFVAALAGYNGGPARAKLWLTWSDYREPAEFVETIPFQETRNYVQSVLRNADVYRRLYGSGAALLATAPEPFVDRHTPPGHQPAAKPAPARASRRPAAKGAAKKPATAARAAPAKGRVSAGVTR